MTEVERYILFKEIDKYYYNFNTINKPCILDFVYSLNNKKRSNKALLLNTYGLLGILIYKYKDYIINNIDIIKYIVKKNIWEMHYIPKNIIIQIGNDKEMMLELIKQDAKIISIGSEKIKNDREIILKAVQKEGNVLYFASDLLKGDKEIILEAVKNYGMALYYASEELKNDEEIVMNALKNDGDALAYASDSLKNSKFIVLEAVKQKGTSIIYASERLRNNYEVAMVALKQNKQALQFIGSKLKNDKRIIKQYKEELSMLKFLEEVAKEKI